MNTTGSCKMANETQKGQPGVVRLWAFTKVNRGCEAYPICVHLCASVVRSSFRRGLTLIEMTIALALTALLLILVNGLLGGVSRWSVHTREASLEARRLEFALEVMRKEIGELRLVASDPQFLLLGGAGTLSYATTRTELIARDEMPNGLVRVDWKFDPDTKTLQRTVTPVSGNSREAGVSRTVTVLDHLEKVQFSVHDGRQWILLSGSNAPVEQPRAIGLELNFIPARSPLFGPALSTAFQLPL